MTPGRAFLIERFPNIYAAWTSASTWRCSPSRWFGPLPVRRRLHRPLRTEQRPRAVRGGRGGPHRAARSHRRASNSLLEGLVFGHRAAKAAAEELAPRPGTDDVPAWDPGSAVDPNEAVLVTQNWEEVRRLMWNYVGIVRTDKRLMRARRRLDLLRE